MRRTYRITTGSKGFMSDTTDRIRSVLKEHARLAIDVDGLKDDSDLFQAGMTSFASVNVMLALEGAFDMEFPDRMLRRGVFESIEAIRAAIEELAKGR
jgi:acyl carrier protein